VKNSRSHFGLQLFAKIGRRKQGFARKATPAKDGVREKSNPASVCFFRRFFACMRVAVPLGGMGVLGLIVPEGGGGTPVAVRLHWVSAPALHCVYSCEVRQICFSLFAGRCASGGSGVPGYMESPKGAGALP
jgi:hypothetical protein